MTAARASGRSAEVRLEAGVYRVWPPAPRETCFPIRQATNLTVLGAGKTTRIVITDPASGGFVFGLCQRVGVRDLILDYDPVPFCQGAIRAVDGQAGSFDLSPLRGAGARAAPPHPAPVACWRSVRSRGGSFIEGSR